jgi:REP element-mobilizing transposase RayT
MRREATGNSRKQAGQNLRAVQDVQSRNSEAKKRFGLSVLNYMVTSNHVHLLVKATGPKVIAESMQVKAGRTAQE